MDNNDFYLNQDYDAWLSSQPNVEEAWHRIEIFGDDDGATAYHSTNDNLDKGYASESAFWITEHRSVVEALRVNGYSRQGIGCRVDVFVNGKQIYEKES